MLTQEQRKQMTSFARVMQILVAAMMAGVIVFAVVTLFLPVPLNKTGDEESAFPILTTIAAMYVVLCFCLAPMVASWIAGAVRKAIASGKMLTSVRVNAPGISQEFLTTPLGLWCKAYMSRTMVFAAVVESGALFCIVAYMLEGNLLCLACAVLAVIYLLMIFPNTDRMERWIEPQQRMVGAAGKTDQLR